VMRAGRTRNADVFDLSASPTAPELASYFRNGRDFVLPDASHFIPMEHPQEVVAQIRELSQST